MQMKHKHKWLKAGYGEVIKCIICGKISYPSKYTGDKQLNGFGSMPKKEGMILHAVTITNNRRRKLNQGRIK